jgi:hypothetical protein
LPSPGYFLHVVIAWEAVLVDECWSSNGKTRK